MQAQRIPVWLLTGALGSGKTTLLAAWLREPVLRNAALVINEVGEVGLDDRLLRPLAQAADASALLANTCVCCSGLPGLEEALADLHRARLERRIARFDRVVIETTGLAEPQPVRAAFERDALLRKRYVLAGVITTVSATAPDLVDAHSAAHPQVDGADLLVLTKTDRVAAGALALLQGRLRTLNPRAALASSALGSLTAGDVLKLLPPANAAAPALRGEIGAAPAAAHTDTRADADAHAHAHHRHEAEALFVALPQPVRRAALAQRLQACIAAADGALLRIKGVVRADDGAAIAVQWSPGDAEAVLAPFSGTSPAPGLTVIAADRAAAEGAARRLRALTPSGQPR
jgi:G3E family GTPase